MRTQFPSHAKAFYIVPGRHDISRRAGSALVPMSLMLFSPRQIRQAVPGRLSARVSPILKLPRYDTAYYCRAIAAHIKHYFHYTPFTITH